MPCSWLTTASLSRGWVPGVSKGFHFWQPAPRLNNAPMAGTTLQPSHEPPRTRDKKQAPVTLEKKGKGGGGEELQAITKRLIHSQHLPYFLQIMHYKRPTESVVPFKPPSPPFSVDAGLIECRDWEGRAPCAYGA